MAKAANIQTTDDAAAGNLLFLLDVVAVILRTVLFVIFHNHSHRVSFFPTTAFAMQTSF